MAFLDTKEKASPCAELSDEDILELSVSRPSAFEEIVRRYEKAFLAKTRSIIGHREEAFDIVQDVFTKIYLNAGRFHRQDGARFSSWAYKILVNTSFTYYQKLKKERGATVRLEEDAFEQAARVDDRERHVLEEYVVTALSRMPRSLSRVLKMHFLDGMSQKDVANDLGISVGAVKARVHRAKKEFKKNDFEIKGDLAYVRK